MSDVDPIANQCETCGAAPYVNCDCADVSQLDVIQDLRAQVLSLAAERDQLKADNDGCYDELVLRGKIVDNLLADNEMMTRKITALDIERDQLRAALREACDLAERTEVDTYDQANARQNRIERLRKLAGGE